ncbi:MAG: aspartate aminotransferase family protein [Sulfurospirillum sp.]|nr:aspartate aminotransferase family protein [Sulfurospirillum sp.]
MFESMDKEFVLQTYPRNYVHFQKGNNATLYADDGKDFIDFTSGIGVVSVGHGNERLANALCDQAKNLIHTSNLFMIEPQAKLAKKISELCGYSVGTFFANSGAEANEGAIKLARAYGAKNFTKRRYKIVTLEYSFHGRTITTVKATGQSSFHDSKFAPYPDGFSFVSNLEDVYAALDDETVAVMLEIIQGEGGVSVFDKLALQKLAQFLQEKKVLLIVDEVQSGVFRSGEFLASQLYGLQPDITTLAKGLAGGVPIGAVISKHKDIFGVGDHGSTFGGNFLSTRAGCEVLDILDVYKKSGELAVIINYFDTALQAFVRTCKATCKEAVGIGLMRGIRLRNGEMMGKILQAAFNEGVLVLKSGRGTLRFLPPLTISKNEIDEGFTRLQNAFKKIS